MKLEMTNKQFADDMAFEYQENVRLGYWDQARADKEISAMKLIVYSREVK